MNLKCELCHKDGIIPTKGTQYSAGYDVYSVETTNINPHQTKLIHTGLKLQIPWGYFGGLFSRSGIAIKRGLRISTGTSVIDPDFRGELMVPLYNDSDIPQSINKGDRIAQLIIMPYQAVMFDIVDELDDTERGDGGFGSTGVN